MAAASTGKHKTAPVTTRLEKDVLAALAHRAELADRTVSAELRRAVRFYLAQPVTERAA